MSTDIISFMDVVYDLSAWTKFRHNILVVAKEVNKNLMAGKDPYDALNFLLEVYQAVPNAQEEIRNVIMEALERCTESTLPPS